MFGLFKNKSVQCPVDDNMREYLESVFQWFINVFGLDFIKGKKVLLADDATFPINYNGEQQCAFDTLKILTAQMDIDPDDILLQFYRDGISEVGAGRAGAVLIGHEDNAGHSSGLYHGRHEDGKYHISIESENLTDPLGLVATMAHELAHIKLLGEQRIEENDEQLTDLATVIYGLGLFAANTSLRVYKGDKKWGYRKLGYLTQLEWGYALAVYAHIRGEEKPVWADYLSDTVKGSFDRAQLFVPESKIFQ